jgi:hypothetical protein
MDELGEFPRSTLEVLRQPLEEGAVTIARAAGTQTLPARFTLVASMNTCPCGFRGDKASGCRCNVRQCKHISPSSPGRCSIASTCVVITMWRRRWHRRYRPLAVATEP